MQTANNATTPTNRLPTEPATSHRLARVDVVQSTAAQPAQSHLARRRGQAAVLTGLGLFVLVQVVLHQLIQTGTLKIQDPIYQEKLGLLQAQADYWKPDASGKVRVLAIGSSRTQLFLNTSQLNSATHCYFNFGCAGCGPVTDALYLRRLLQAGLQCDEVIIELHPAMLVQQNPPFEHRWLHTYRLNSEETSTLKKYGWNLETPIQYCWHGPLQTSYTYRYALLNAFAPRLLPCPFGLGLLSRTDAHGHVPGIEIQAKDRPKFLAAAYIEYLSSFENYQPGGPAVEAIRDMLTQLQQRGIGVRLLLTPESSEFRNWYGEGKQHVISQFAIELSQEFHVPLIDAREWLPDEQFTDGHHATPSGAKAFTEKLQGVLR
jgi:hypothetical protein